MNKAFLATLWLESAIIFQEDNQEFDSISNLFQIPNIDNEVLFNALSKVENDERFYLELSTDKKQEMLWQYIHAIENSWSINRIQIRDYANIKALYLWEIGENHEKILFSKVFPKHKIQSSKYLVIDGEPTIKTKLNSIDINWEIHAYWNWQKLYFQSYKTISSLFPWISDFYVTATEEEKDNFLNNWFFNIPWDITIWERNMKKIAFIMREMNIDFSSKTTRTKYKKYAIKYSQIFDFDNDHKVEIKNNADLTNIIQVIQWCFYTSELTWLKMKSDDSKPITV